MQTIKLFIITVILLLSFTNIKAATADVHICAETNITTHYICYNNNTSNINDIITNTSLIHFNTQFINQYQSIQDIVINNI